MSRFLGIIIFCGLCTFVLADDNGEPCIFDWEDFEPQANSDDIILDYSEQKISTLTDNGMTYHYITGPAHIKAVVDDSYDVFYNVIKVSGENPRVVLSDIRDACYFLHNIFPSFLLPIGGTHNDFPPKEKICPQQPGTTKSFPTDNVKDLVSPSKLDEGKYELLVSFMKNNKVVGGIGGTFNVLRQ